MIARPVLFPSLGVGGVSLLQGVALLPPLAFSIFERGGGHVVLLAVALVTAVFWDLVFASVRKHRFYFHGITTAVIVAVLVPSALPWWQLALSLSLGCVLGEHIFGGRGFGFLSPAAICLSLLLLSFPQVRLEPLSQSVALATLPGAFLLLVTGLISGRVMLSALAVIGGLAFSASPEVDLVALAAPTLFGLVFLICDPVSAASTKSGRWIYGLLAGLLISIFSKDVAAITSAGIIFGSLTVSVFAPLIDHLMVLAHAKRRQMRQRARHQNV